MPWCEACSKYFSPSTLSPRGECPQCDRELPRVPLSGKVSASELNLRKLAGATSDEQERTPWHFRLLVSLLVAYLAWRVVQVFI